MIYLSQALIFMTGTVAFILLIFGNKPLESLVVVILTLLCRNVFHNPENYIKFIDIDEIDKHNGVN